MVVALAGRRIDSNDSVEKRFPLANVGAVEDRLLNFFQKNQVARLICSGANGADLIALKVATALRIPREIVLPFDAETFKKLSVVDRPGNWTFLFNEYYDELSKNNGVKILALPVSDTTAYDKTSLQILDRAQDFSLNAVAGENDVHAIVVWDGKSKKENDASDVFYREALRRHIPVTEISTL